MNPDFEQNHFSRTAEGPNKIGHDSMRLLKSMCIDTYYEIINNFDLMGSVLLALKENSKF